MNISRIRAFGVVSTVAIVVASFGAGATRNQGGVLDALGLTFLSFGHGGGISNAVLWLGMFGFIATWAMLGRAVQQLQVNTRDINRLLLAWIIPLVFAAPILSRDVYSYLMQGAMLRDGFDPYTQGAAVNPGPLLLEVSHDWRNTTTPYGPLHLWIGAGITRLVGDNVTLGVLCYKMVSLVGFLLIALTVPRIAAILGGNPTFAQWFCVANPVMVFHLIGGMHNESLMVGLVSVGVYLALKDKYALAVVAIAVSVSLKATAVFALPFVVWMGLRHALRRYPESTPSRVKELGWFVLTGSWMSVLALSVVSAVTWLSGASWGWVSQISGNSKVINPLALPSLIAGVITPLGKLFDDDFAYNSVLAVTRPITQVLMLVALVAVWWLFRHNKVRAVQGIVAAYIVAVILNSVTLPWYYTSLINLAAVFPLSRNAARWAVGLSIIISASFTGSGNHMLYNLPWMVSLIVLALLLTTYIFPTEASATRLAAKSPSTAPVA